MHLPNASFFILSFAATFTLACTLEQSTYEETESVSGNGNGNGNGNQTSTGENGGHNDPVEQPSNNDAPSFSLDAHIDESCDLDYFPGFLLTVHTLNTTCQDRYSTGEESMQFTIGESAGLPTESRTYIVSSDTNEWGLPSDGKLAVHKVGHSVTTGTLSIKPNGDGFEGSYDVRDDENHFVGTFISDVCVLDGTDCE